MNKDIQRKLKHIKSTIDSLLMESAGENSAMDELHQFANSIKPDQSTWARIREIIVEKLVLALKRLKETIGFAHLESEGDTTLKKLYDAGKKIISILSNANPVKRLDNALSAKLLMAGILGFIVYLCGAAYFYAGPKGENLINVITSSIKSGFNELVKFVKEFTTSIKYIEGPKDLALLVIDILKAVVRLPGKFVKGVFGDMEEKKFFSFMGEYEIGITIFGSLLIYVGYLMQNGTTNA
mgnify:CR=1 FL=1